MRSHQTLSVLLLSLALSPFSSHADTIVGGPITVNATWAASNSPFVVSQSVVVVNGATLTIDPGVEVRFNPDLAILVNDGQLIARGTQVSNIVFTAARVPPGAESNRWGYIRFEDTAIDAIFDGEGNYTNGCVIEYAVVEYAGGTDVEGAIHAKASAPLIGQCDFHHNANGGIYGDLASGIMIVDNLISNNSFLGSAGAVSLTGSNIVVSGNIISDNTGGVAAVYLYSADNIHVMENTIMNNTGPGISCGGSFGYGIQIISNVVHGNSSRGISVFSSQSAVINANIIQANGESGINLSSAHSAVVTDNRVIGNLSWSGIYVNMSDDVLVEGNTICSNSAHLYGGGVCFRASDDPVLRDNVILDNSGSQKGGGVCCGRANNKCSRPLLTGNTIRGNSAGEGGGIYLYSFDAIVSNNIISSNLAANGAGVYSYFQETTVTVTENNIQSNTASWDGGGLYLYGASLGQADLTGNLIAANSSDDGGGVFLQAMDEITFTGNDISRNTASNGGGLYISGSTSVLLQGNTISSNVVTGSGSAAYLTDSADGVVLSIDPAFPSRILGNVGSYSVYNDNTFSSFDDPGSPGNVDGRNVWWGTTNSTEISAAIYDFFDDAGKGRVFYEPFLDLFDIWLVEHGLGTNAMGDADTDGSPNEDEYYAGTDPTNQYSVFAISNVAPFSATQMLIHWYSVSNRTYAVQTCTNLQVQGWDDLTNGLSGTPPLNTVTMHISGAEAMFFRVNVSP